MKWNDIHDIVFQLLETYPDTNPECVNFVDLRTLVLNLSDFDDHPNHCGEKILETIQAVWIEELN